MVFITKYQKVQHLYRTMADKELLKPAETRFAYFFVVVSRLYEVRPALEKLFTNDAFRTWLDSQRADIRETAADLCFTPQPPTTHPHSE